MERLCKWAMKSVIVSAQFQSESAILRGSGAGKQTCCCGAATGQGKAFPLPPGRAAATPMDLLNSAPSLKVAHPSRHELPKAALLQLRLGSSILPLCPLSTHLPLTQNYSSSFLPTFWDLCISQASVSSAMSPQRMDSASTAGTPLCTSTASKQDDTNMLYDHPGPV